MSAYSPTARTTLHRRPGRGTYDRATVHAILDEALVCHLGFVVDGQPFVLPTTFVRDGERVFVHGAGAGRLMRTLSSGVRACMTVTLLDGLVLARSAFRHSMNYRSVLVLGAARKVTDREEKLHAMALLVDKISPGRSAQARAPNDKELGATTVLSLPLEEVSAKCRVGPPLDDAEDFGVPVWAGVAPVSLRAGPLERDAQGGGAGGAGGSGFEDPRVPPALREDSQMARKRAR